MKKNCFNSHETWTLSFAINFLCPHAHFHWYFDTCPTLLLSFDPLHSASYASFHFLFFLRSLIQTGRPTNHDNFFQLSSLFFLPSLSNYNLFLRLNFYLNPIPFLLSLSLSSWNKNSSLNKLDLNSWFFPESSRIFSIPSFFLSRSFLRLFFDSFVGKNHLLLSPQKYSPSKNIRSFLSKHSLSLSLSLHSNQLNIQLTFPENLIHPLKTYP